MSDQRIEVNSGFYDSVNGDRLYSADQMNMPYKRIVADGVFATNYGDPSSDLQVVSANDGLNIKVNKGEAIVGTKWFNNPETKTITVPANTSANPRIDSVFIQTDKSIGVRSGAIVYRTGEPDASPEPPSISEDPEIIEIRIANIAVAVNASTITNAEITDLRGSSDCPWVTGLITQVDTSTLWAQFQSAYAQQYEQYNEDFENYIRAQRSAWATFIEGLTDDLTVATNIVALENKYTASDTVLSIPVGIQNYNPQTDVLQVFINGILAFENDKYTINAAGTTITLANPIAAGNTVYFVVYKNLVTGNVDSIQNEIAGLQAAIGSPLVASTVAEMTDTSRVYVYVGSETGYTAGNWYYYNTSEWVSGGVYNSAAVQTDTSLTQSGMAADAKATGDAIAEISGGLTDEAKEALLACFAHVAWASDDGQDYYDDLEESLYNTSPLVSISAVYTQSGTVYDTDSLDSLRSDLVVTAVYEDTSTETVTTYTLSGTLTTGTSTITVTYKGKTTTFTVTVTHESRTLLHSWDFTQSLTDSVGGITAVLSKDYTDGSLPVRDANGLSFTQRGQCCDLGEVFGENRWYEIDFTTFDLQAATTAHTRSFMFGTADTTGDGIMIHRNSRWTVYAGSWWSGSYTVPSDQLLTYFANKTAKIFIDSNRYATLYANDTDLGTSGVAFASGSKHFYLGNRSQSSSGGNFNNVTVTGLRIYSDGGNS